MRETVSTALDVGRGRTDGNSLSLLHFWQTSGLQMHWYLRSHAHHLEALEESG